MTINTQLLNEAATEFKEELLVLPATTIQEQNQGSILVETGVKSKLVLGSMYTDPEFAPRKSNAVFQDNNATADARILTVNIGQAILREDRHTFQRLADRIARGYRTSTAAGEFPLEARILASMAREIGRKINLNALFGGVYDANGTTTASVMDGFNTIVGAEITANKISTAKKNLFQAQNAITEANVGDVLEDFWKSREDELRSADAFLLMPSDIWDLYNRWYLNTFGSVVYNAQYAKGVLHCAPNVKLHWVSGMKNSPYLHLYRRDNLVFGIDETNDESSIEVRRDNDPNKVQFIYTAAVGAELESINARIYSAAEFTIGS